MSGDHLQSERMQEYVLGELEGAAHSAVAAHLAGCAACRKEVVSLQTALAIYRDTAPASVDGRILRRLLAEQETLGRRRRFAWRWHVTDVGLAAVAAGMIFLGGVWVGRQGVATPTQDGAGVVPTAAVVLHRTAEAPPRVTFAVADVDRLGGLASRDTTWN